MDLLISSNGFDVVLKEDKYDELVDDGGEELLDELLESLILVFLSFFPWICS